MKVNDEKKGKSTRCPICQSSSSLALTKDDCPYFQCGQCEFLFHRFENDSTAAGRASFYDQGYWQMERAEAIRREKEDSFLRALELLYISTIKVETILDFGCGFGLTVELLRDKLGLDAVGVDPSADFVETQYLHRCDLQSLSVRYPQGHFDAIYSIEVFEHLADPGQILSLLCALLKPGGKILINTGTREFLGKYDPEFNYVDPLHRGHISIYSIKSFARLASSVGRTAAFLGERKYQVILSPVTGLQQYPHPENLERIRRLGGWFPALMREYIRLIDVEREFEERSLWALRLSKETEALRSRLPRLCEESKPTMRALWRKLWNRKADSP